MTENERFKIVRKELGLSQEALADALDMEQGSISDVERGKVGVSDNIKFKLKRKFGVNIEFIETGTGVPLQKGTVNIEEKRVPYYDIDATAGNVTLFEEGAQEYIKQYITVPAFNDCEMFINVSGNSMYPKYCSGEAIGLKKIEDYDVVPYGEAYLIVTKEQRLLKYIRKGRDKDHWLLTSENSEFEPFEIPKKKVLHLYIVKGKITKNII